MKQREREMLTTKICQQSEKMLCVHEIGREDIRKKRKGGRGGPRDRKKVQRKKIVIKQKKEKSTAE